MERGRSATNVKWGAVGRGKLYKEPNTKSNLVLAGPMQ